MFDIKSRLQSKAGRQLEPEDVPQIHHDFMRCYGWIPLEEYKKMGIKQLLTLYPMVQKYIKGQEELRIYTVRLLAGQVGAKQLKNYK